MVEPDLRCVSSRTAPPGQPVGTAGQISSEAIDSAGSASGATVNGASSVCTDPTAPSGHVDQVSFDQLDAGVLGEDAGLAEPLEVVDRELVAGRFDDRAHGALIGGPVGRWRKGGPV